MTQCRKGELDDVIQMKYNEAEELFSCLQTHWYKHGSIPQ